MSDLKLVAPDQPTPLEKLLMDAVSHEQPSGDQRARVRHALGLAPILAVPLAVKPPLKPTWHVFAKAAAGAVVVAGAVAGFLFLRAPSAPNPLHPTPVAAPVPAPVAAPVPAPVVDPAAPPVIQAD